MNTLSAENHLLINNWIKHTQLNAVLLALCAPLTLQHSDTPYARDFRVDFVRLVSKYLGRAPVLILCSDAMYMPTLAKWWLKGWFGVHYPCVELDYAGNIDRSLFPERFPPVDMAIFNALTRGVKTTEICRVSHPLPDGVVGTSEYLSSDIKKNSKVPSHRILCLDI
jgi:hypothetical protein